MLHLLIVSHSPLLSSAISMALRGSLVDVSCIAPSRCIIEACLARHFDLIIFLGLSPYFTSMNIVEHLKARVKPMPSIYVISHSHCEATILSLLECGVDQYMTFPVNLHRLRRKVYTLLERKEVAV